LRLQCKFSGGNDTPKTKYWLCNIQNARTYVCKELQQSYYTYPISNVCIRKPIANKYCKGIMKSTLLKFLRRWCLLTQLHGVKERVKQPMAKEFKILPLRSSYTSTTMISTEISHSFSSSGGGNG